MTALSLTQDRIKELLHYNPNAGDFTWLISTSNRVKVGDIAGCLMANGYLIVRVDGTLHLAHRLAWFYEYGVWPVDQIDHINHIRNDNRMINLCESTDKENRKNQSKSKLNTSGFSGVCWYRRYSKWKVQITVNYKEIHLGYFTTYLAACYARHAANLKYGFHENHGS